MRGIVVLSCRVESRDPAGRERWDYLVLELNQKFKLQMIESLIGYLVRYLPSDQTFPTETLGRGKKRGNSDLGTVCKCMLVKLLCSLVSLFRSQQEWKEYIKCVSLFSFIF